MQMKSSTHTGRDPARCSGDKRSMSGESQIALGDPWVSVIYTLRLQLIVSIFNMFAVERPHDRCGYEVPFQEGVSAQFQP